MMEGEIIIDSKPGMGTEVTILIPEKGNECLIEKVNSSARVNSIVF